MTVVMVLLLFPPLLGHEKAKTSLHRGSCLKTLLRQALNLVRYSSGIFLDQAAHSVVHRDHNARACCSKSHQLVSGFAENSKAA
jgi:hypothetical protein